MKLRKLVKKDKIDKDSVVGGMPIHCNECNKDYRDIQEAMRDRPVDKINHTFKNTIAQPKVYVPAKRVDAYQGEEDVDDEHNIPVELKDAQTKMGYPEMQRADMDAQRARVKYTPINFKAFPNFDIAKDMSNDELCEVLPHSPNCMDQNVMVDRKKMFITITCSSCKSKLELRK